MSFVLPILPMTKTVIIALDFPSNYVNASFKEQLQFLETHVQKVIDLLKKDHNDADEWIISWREYGLNNNAKDIFISSEQKASFKNIMNTLSNKDPRLSIVGTVATKRLINLSDKERAARKITGIAEAYKVNAQFAATKQFNLHKEQSECLVNRNFYLIRNTAYVFSKGQCRQRHDKLTPFEETKGLNNGLFRPGANRSRSNLLHANLGIEICMEHQCGVLGKTTPPESLPTIQMVVSASTALVPTSCVSPYVVHIDSVQPIRLITTKDPGDAEVSLYTYDFSDPNLKAEAPQTLREAVMDDIGVSLESGDDFDIESLLFDGTHKEILQPDDYVILLKIAIEKYIESSKALLGKGIDFEQLDSLQPSLLWLLSKVSSLACVNQEEDKKLFNKLVCYAILNQDATILDNLFKNYMKFFDRSKLGDKFLNFVLKTDNLSLFKLLYDDKLAVDDDRKTLLHLAEKVDASSISQFITQAKMLFFGVRQQVDGCRNQENLRTQYSQCEGNNVITS